MTRFFNYDFTCIEKELLQDLNTLETEGAIYAYLWQDEVQEFVYTRLRLEPPEIVEYVDASRAFNEFLSLKALCGDASLALSRISDERIAARVQQYNEWAASIGQDTLFCFAAFLGEHLEGLVTGIVEGRHEVIGRSYSGDRRFLLMEILEMFPQSISSLEKRLGNRPPFVIEKEQDVRDLLYSILKCVFPDTRMEEYTSKHAGATKRIDIVIPGIQTVIEVKFVRDASHSKTVADELKIDFESYHVHPHCKTLVAFVWDSGNHLPDQYNFVKDLRGLRVKGTSHFNVEVVVKP